MLQSEPTKELANAEIVAGIMAQDPAVMAAFYRQFEHRLRYLIARHCDRAQSDVDDLVQEVFLIAIRQIRRGDLRDPETLAGFLAVIAKRAAWTTNESHSKLQSLDASPGLEYGLSMRHQATTPEQAVLIAEQAALMRRALTHLSPFHIEILTRFYLRGEKEDQIRAAMKMSGNVFRIEKSRAKTKLTEAVAELMQGKAPKRYRELINRAWEKAA